LVSFRRLLHFSLGEGSSPALPATAEADRVASNLRIVDVAHALLDGASPAGPALFKGALSSRALNGLGPP
jgi:hypothetical protein